MTKKNRPASAAKSSSNDKPQKKAIVVRYDKDGNRIGDDGFEMTSARRALHFLLNASFVWGIVCLIASIAMAVAAFAQGQSYVGEGIDVTFVGGNLFNGVEMAFLLRVEALLALFTAVMGPLISIQGFRWLYERRSATFTLSLTLALLLASLIFAGYALTVVGYFDPLSALSIILVVAIWIAMKRVEAERPQLTKPKVARTERK